MAPDHHETLDRWERLLDDDPGRRGAGWLRKALARYDAPQAPVHTLAAAARLLQSSAAVGLVTGFAVYDGARWCGETDGPPGTLYLARVLAGLGKQVTLLSDGPTLEILDAGRRFCGLESCPLVEIRADGTMVDHLELDALVAIERAGPSHTLDSLRRQRREGPAPEADFLAASPREGWGRLHNMRGEWIDAQLAPAQVLFESPDSPASIGIGDGGNELGMGSIPWEHIAAAIPQGLGARIACGVATTHTLAAGVSNWGAYALGAAVGLVAQRMDLVVEWPASNERDLLQCLVHAGAVDGVTRLATPTVDGLDDAIYFSLLEKLVL